MPLLTLIFVAVASCTGMRAPQTKQLLDPYIGHRLSEVAARFGPPTGNFDMGQGLMAFEWDRFGLDQPGAADCRVMFAALPTYGNTISTPPTDLANWIIQTWQPYGSGCP